MRIVSIFFISVISIFSGHTQQTTNPENPPVHKVIVQEVLQTSAYTYLKVKEDTTRLWLAVPKIEVNAGDTVYCNPGMEMRDFKSKELNKTFSSILFMDMVSKTPEGLMKKEMAMPGHGKKSVSGKKDIKFEQVPGQTSLAEIFRDLEVYSGKKVMIKGEVVKFNDGILGKNWAHLQDGSSFGDEYDLTVTMKDSLNIGDKVTLEGKITLNKDFGSGYFFKVIMEDAVIIK